MIDNKKNAALAWTKKKNDIVKDNALFSKISSLECTTKASWTMEMGVINVLPLHFDPV